MATSIITITDLDEGGVSIEIEHALLRPGTSSIAQQIALALRDQLNELGLEFESPSMQVTG